MTLAGLIKLKPSCDWKGAEISISAGLTPQTSSIEKPRLRCYDPNLGDWSVELPPIGPHEEYVVTRGILVLNRSASDM